MKNITILLFLGMLLLVVGCGKKGDEQVSGAENAGAPENLPAGGNVSPGAENGLNRNSGMQLPDEWEFLDYPGATKEDGADQEQRGFQGGSYFTTDPLGKVTAFYIEQLAAKDPRILETALVGGKTVTITLKEVGQKVAIVLIENPGRSGTRIDIKL